jgi:hypothetical protein
VQGIAREEEALVDEVRLRSPGICRQETNDSGTCPA